MRRVGASMAPGWSPTATLAMPGRSTSVIVLRAGQGLACLRGRRPPRLLHTEGFTARVLLLGRSTGAIVLQTPLMHLMMILRELQYCTWTSLPGAH